MSAADKYTVVQLRNGAFSVHSAAHGETMHPGLGPAAEARELYVRQLQLVERQLESSDEFVVWDVGLGAAANASTVLRASNNLNNRLRLISFEHTLEPLQLALRSSATLGYLAGYEPVAEKLVVDGAVTFGNGRQKVSWTLHLGDFPAFIRTREAAILPKPHAILFDPWSPAKNPAMWTAPLFADLFRLLDSSRHCAMPTYSRSTMLRVALLLAGFFVGTGRASGMKEETTIAANVPDLVPSLLGREFLARAQRSESAEPLWDPVYRQARLHPSTLELLRKHPQFA